MQQRKVPQRTCVICRERHPKQALGRFVCPTAQASGLVCDPVQILPGRGFYVCDKDTCRTKFERYKGWRRKCQGVTYDER